MARSRFTSSILVGNVLLGCCITTHVLAQEPSPSGNIRVESSNVVVDVIVTDRHGRPMRGLRAEDFTVYEDGSPQKIVGFSASQSESSSSMTTSASNVPIEARSPEQVKAVPRQPQLFTVVMDLADNRPASTKLSADAVQKYLEKTLSANDYVAIYYVDRRLHLALPFTNDLASARAVLKQIETRSPSGTFSGSSRNEIEHEINDLSRQAHPESQYGGIAGDPAAAPTGQAAAGFSPGNNMAEAMDREVETLRSYLNMQNMFQARAIFAALRAICLSYRDMPGRKNVVLFSEGFLYSDDARPDMEAVADTANRTNVAIYVIDPTGVEVHPYGAGDRPMDTINAQMVAASAPGVSKVGQNHGETKFDKIKMVGELTRGDQLGWLADTTGGFMVKGTNDLVPAFGKVLDDSRNFYMLAYRPQNKGFDGKFHPIKVELRQGGYKVRYRNGYWAVPTGEAVAMTPVSAQLISGLQSGSLKSVFSPDLRAIVLLAPDGHYAVPVTVSIPGTRIPFEKEADGYKAAMTMVLVARDGEGKIIASNQRAWTIRADKAQRENLEKGTMNVQEQVSVPGLQPFSVQAILRMSENTVAESRTEVPIPGASDSGPRLTSILLSNHLEQASCTDTSDPLCLQNVRLSQPVAMQFPASGRLVVYFAASDLSLDPQTKKPRVGVAFTVKSGKDVVKTANAENVQALPGPVPNSVLVLAEYDLKSLQPGKYTIQAVAQDMVRHASQSQQASFAVQ